MFKIKNDKSAQEVSLQHDDNGDVDIYVNATRVAWFDNVTGRLVLSVLHTESSDVQYSFDLIGIGDD
jgi:hypothetical protein